MNTCTHCRIASLRVPHPNLCIQVPRNTVKFNKPEQSFGEIVKVWWKVTDRNIILAPQYLAETIQALDKYYVKDAHVLCVPLHDNVKFYFRLSKLNARSYYSPRKEKALKIYTDEPPSPKHKNSTIVQTITDSWTHDLD